MSEQRQLHDLEAEESVLGAMLFSASAIAAAAELLEPEDFYRPSHGTIYRAIIDIHEAGGAVDSIILIDALARRGELEGAGGKPAISTLPSTVPSVTNAARYAEIVVRLAAERRLVQAAEEIAHAGQNGGITAEQRQRLAAALEQGTSATAPAFKVYTTEQLATIPPPDYLLDGHLVAGALNVLFGPSDRYKSFIAIDWACTIAAGLDWFQRPARRGVVVYVAGEGGSGLWQRVEAWAASRETEPPNLHWITEPVNLYDQQEAARFARWIGKLPEPPALVVFDTIARCMVGADENSSRDMGMVIAHADQIRHQHGCAVLGLHHTGHEHQGRERGSSALMGAADCRIKATGDTPLTVQIEAVKVKDAERGEPATLHLEPVRRSLVITRASTKPEARAADARQAIRDHLDAQPQSPTKTIEDVVPMRRDEVRKALADMVDQGEVVVADGPRGAKLHSLSTTSPGLWGEVGRGQPGTPQSTSPHAPRSKRGEAGGPETTSPRDLAPTDYRDPVDSDLEDGGG